jgi:hypothetical protein
MKPKRFKNRRGQKLKPGQKLVGRNTRWGNPFPVEGKIDPASPPRLVKRYAEKWGVPVKELVCKSDRESVGRYREALKRGELDYGVADVREQLRGLDLGCPCDAEHCHADVLLKVANDG